MLFSDTITCVWCRMGSSEWDPSSDTSQSESLAVLGWHLGRELCREAQAGRGAGREGLVAFFACEAVS